MLNNLINKTIYKIFSVSVSDVIQDIRNCLDFVILNFYVKRRVLFFKKYFLSLT